MQKIRVVSQKLNNKKLMLECPLLENKRKISTYAQTEKESIKISGITKIMRQLRKKMTNL